MNLDRTLFINFIDLSDNDKLIVLDWRNNENIRKWMYSSEIISKEAHLIFIDSLKTDASKQYYLVSYKEEDIGVIYFKDINNTNQVAEFGLYSNPRLRGNGKLLMETICEYAFNILNLNKITAEVFADNLVAINLYQHFKFQKVNENIHNNRKIIYMELKN